MIEEQRIHARHDSDRQRRAAGLYASNMPDGPRGASIRIPKRPARSAITASPMARRGSKRRMMRELRGEAWRSEWHDTARRHAPPRPDRRRRADHTRSRRAAGGSGGTRRPARRGDRGRGSIRPRAGDGQPAGLRPEPDRCRNWERLTRNEPHDSAAQPRDSGPLPAGRRAANGDPVGDPGDESKSSDIEARSSEHRQRRTPAIR